MASGAELAMILRARDEASPTFDKVKSSAGGLGSSLSGMMGGLAVAGGAVTGVLAIGSAISSVAQSMVSGNVEMETYQTQLGTLLGGADAAKQRISELAKIGAETPFDLPQLVAAEKIMAGFGLTTEKTQQLSGRSLDQYRTSIGDMAAATGADLSEVTLLWSKFGSGATGEAISRLQELGIVTREQMAAMGIEFSKSGELVSPIPEAMKVAMDLADKKMGGGMKALSSTFAGQMSTLSDNFGQAKTLLMAPIFDVLKDGLTSLNEVLSSEMFTSTITSMAETGAAAISTLIEVFGGLFDVFKGGGSEDDLMNMAMRLADFFPLNVASEIVNGVNMVGGVFDAVFAGDLPDVITSTMRVLESLGTLVVVSMEEMAAAFVSWIPEVETGWGAGFGELATQIMSWILDASFGIVEQLASWVGAFLDWIGPMIGPTLRELGTYISAVWGWMAGTALPAIAQRLAQWGLAFVEWIGPRIGPMLAEAASLLASLGGWIIGTALPAIASQLLEWGTAFVTWVEPQIPGLLAAMGGLLVQLGAWMIGTALPAIVTSLAAWGMAFVKWVATDVIPALPGALGEILSSITGWIGGAVGSIMSAAGGLGRALIDGIVSAIRNGVSSISGAVMDVISSGLAAGRSDNESNSPSRKWARELGTPLLEGILEPFLTNGRGAFASAVMDVARPVALGPSLAATGSGALGGGGQPIVVNLNVAGSLIHERELPRLVSDALGSGLRQGIPLGARR